ncbi:MAG TPA: hydroxymethylbilane synthase [Candidatus Limnocylindrales bacterium]|nr:hydroxymethylbilane synthase [Candidatus Limnocylindrales bacterium]
MTSRALRVGTRRSPLALTQTRQSMDELVRRSAGASYELVEITTTGDRIVDRPLREAGGKGLFLKELDEALVSGRIDCAVHSLKDVPTELAAGTTIAAVLERADARDLLVTTGGLDLSALPTGAVIGTTSLRRQAQALAEAPHLNIRMLRGNVETRLRKLADGEYDATFLAAAGLGRLGIDLSAGGPARAVALDPFTFVPAAGQGAVAITARIDDRPTRELLARLDHAASRIAAAAERGFARMFGGGCSLPLAAYAECRAGELVLVGLVVSPDGHEQIRDRTSLELPDGSLAGADARAEELGRSLARSFFERGASRIIDAANAAEIPR